MTSSVLGVEVGVNNECSSKLPNSFKQESDNLDLSVKKILFAAESMRTRMQDEESEEAVAVAQIRNDSDPSRRSAWGPACV